MKTYAGYPEHVDAAAEDLAPASGDVAVRAAKADGTVHRISELVHQALSHPAPPADTVRRARELADGLDVAAAAGRRLLALIDAEARERAANKSKAPK